MTSILRLRLILEKNRVRRWHVTLVERLKAAGHVVAIDFTLAPPVPSGLGLLLDVERRLVRRGRPLGCDPLSLVAVPGAPGAEMTADLTIDLSHAPQSDAWQVRYDGVVGEDAAWEAIFSGEVPVFELVDGATGEVLERGHVSTESAVGAGGKLDAVTARLISLTLARVNARTARRSRPIPPAIPYTTHGKARSARGVLGREIVYGIIHRIYRLLCYAPHWRVGWRYNDGPGVLERGDLGGPRWHVLPDPGGVFYADPFPVVWQGQEAIFFEDLDHKTNKGIISVVMMGPHGPTGPGVPVLDEPWHLSYPHIFEHDGALYMIPESSLAGDVALYRCTSFPLKWERVATLLDNLTLGDATVFQHQGRWWMTGVARDDAGGYSDMLAVYHSTDLMSGWTGHVHNPIFVDCATARPAGSVIIRDGRLLRPVQDCTHGYGMALGIAEITRLDEGAYEQKLIKHIRPGGPWPGRKLHSLNRAGRLEVIDGSVIRPRTGFAKALMEQRTAPPLVTDEQAAAIQKT